MDEFFDFEKAANHVDQTGYSNDSLENFDMNLTLAEASKDEDAFLCLAHFTKDAPDHQISFDLHSPIAGRVTADNSGFPSWVDDRDMPQQTCQSCLERGFHCKTIKSGSHKGSCTSCVALDRACSLVINDSPGDGDDEDCDGLEDQSEPRESLDIFSSTTDRVAADGVAIKSSHSSASDLQLLRSMKEEVSDASGPLKTGTRFSRASLRVLRGWLTAHHRLPYPTDEDKESLQKQTGLSKTQISNWIANARRRGKVRAPRTVSPGPNRLSSPIDIPRRGTPIPREVGEMNPLERWENSPPEHEAASVAAIANAISSGGLINGDGSPVLDCENGDCDSVAAKSCNRSSTSGFGTSGSSGDSFASAFSYDSRNSFGSLVARGRRRRGHRRQITKPSVQGIPAPAAPRKFQCTFCTESFKTKHDWQRHEKSLHLSLERWICAPKGPTVLSPETNTPVCAFCGVSNPNEAHLEFHNCGTCAERTLEERTFYRKDHLRQHLLLVHDSNFNTWSMDAWRVATPPMKSRCGFCDIKMDTWAIRVDHLAKHFKSGSDMKDWKGDWGFEPQVLSLVENGMPPYLINFDRNTPKPYKASKENPESQRQPFDLVKMGLVDYINERVANGGTPTDEDLLNEARQIHKSLDGAAKGRRYRGVSWFRDLFMTGTPYVGPKNTERSLLMAFQSDPECGSGRCCPNETKLKDFVVARLAIGAPPMTYELQNEAARILVEAELTSTFPCEPALAWFTYLITSSSDWLEDFRRRVGLPLQSDLAQNDTHFATGIEYDTYNGAQLQKELTDYVNMCLSTGLPQPSDADLQRQARISLFGVDDTQYQTVADNPDWLKQFKHRYDHLAHAAEIRSTGFSIGEVPDEMLAAYALFGGIAADTSPFPKDSKKTLHWDISPSPGPGSTGASNSGSSKANTFNPMANSLAPFARLALPLYPQNMMLEPFDTNSTVPTSSTNDPNSMAPRRYFFSDANCYRRLMYELSRFVASCLSSNNPTPHVPTDEEIQRQARWILYDDDDPWNQTAADNEEWLSRFKRDVGLIATDQNPGLGVRDWNDLQPGPEGWMPCDGGNGYDQGSGNT